MKNNSHLTFLLLHTSFTTSFTTSFSLFFILIIRDVHILLIKLKLMISPTFSHHIHLVVRTTFITYEYVSAPTPPYNTSQSFFISSSLLSSSLCLPSFLSFQIRHFDREILKLLICDFFKAYYDMFAVRVSA